MMNLPKLRSCGLLAMSASRSSPQTACTILVTSRSAGIDQIGCAALRIGIDIGRFEDDFLLKNGKRLNRDPFIRPVRPNINDCLGAGQFNGLLDGGRAGRRIR